MAVFRSSFLHELKKSVAENTYYRSRGQNIMRFKIATNHSKTPKQQQQRARLKRCVELCDLFSPAIAVGFPTAPVRWSAYNAFVETNMQAVTADEAGNVNVDYERILVSKGKLMMPESLQMAWSEADHTLTFTHEEEEYGKNIRATDVLYALVANREKGISKLYKLNTHMEAGTSAVSVPEKWGKESLAVYAFMLSEDGRKASRSVHMPIE